MTQGKGIYDNKSTGKGKTVYQNRTLDLSAFDVEETLKQFDREAKKGGILKEN